jgi:hypothetical protein
MIDADGLANMDPKHFLEACSDDVLKPELLWKIEDGRTGFFAH